MLSVALSATVLVTYLVASQHGYRILLILDSVGEWGAEVAVLLVLLATSIASTARALDETI